MAIVKMKTVTIAGPLEQFDYVLENYIADKEIHLEDALSVLSNKERLYPFEDSESFEPIIKRVENITEKTGIVISKKIADKKYSLYDMEQELNKIEALMHEDNIELAKLEDELVKAREIISKLSYVSDIDVDFSKLNNFEYMSYAFGKLPKASYKTLNTYLSDIDAVFAKTKEDSKYIWGFYFTTLAHSENIDEIFSSLYFEKLEIPKECFGVPKDIIARYKAEEERILSRMTEIKEITSTKLEGSISVLSDIYTLSKTRMGFSEIRKKAVHSADFFYIVGWMPIKEAKKLEDELSNEKKPIMFVATDPDKTLDIQPPTKIKNNPIFKPFELFVKMYGLPDYYELDPTPILALTYILFFGIMFGDVGQSAVFAIFGFLIYKLKKSQLAGIIGTVGLSGVIFGFVYGSVFGDEEILTPIISPMHNINFMLIVTIGIGVGIIIMGLLLNIINSFKSRQFGSGIFGHNGIAGLAFYLTIILKVLSMITGAFAMPGALVGIIITITILLMYFEEPLSKLIEGKKDWLPKDGMFFVESLFEMFEVILSFFTNTISFLRVGAFAIVHVGMMMVVAVLSKGGGVGGTIVYIIGNIVVMGLEGLIVGIQVLRLEYYEMFSRYFSGRGREFISVNNKD